MKVTTFSTQRNATQRLLTLLCSVLTLLLQTTGIFAQVVFNPSGLPDGLESHRLFIGTTYSISDEFTDFNNWSAVDISETTTLPFDSPLHPFVASLFADMRAKNFYRHAKTNGFKRIHFCVGADDPFFNLQLFDGATCDETLPFGSPAAAPFLQSITESAHQNNLGFGLYLHGMDDFFFEIGLETGANTTGKLTVSQCLCRQFQNPITNGDYWNDEVLLSNVNVETWMTQANGDYLNINNNGLRSHYECPFCNEWRNLLSERLNTMSAVHPEYIFFDVRHTHERGCWCINCRDRYEELFPGQPYLGLTFIGTADVSGSSPGEFHSENDFEVGWAMSRWMNRAVEEHFSALNPVMNANNTLSIVSVQDLPALNTDDHYTSFLRHIDIPKTEWTMTLKRSNNLVFWGGQQNLLLSNYRIPEDIRMAVGIGLVRDASKFRIPFVWISEKDLLLPLENWAGGFATNSIINNHRLRGFLGFGYTLGTIASTNIDKAVYIDAVDNTIQNQVKIWNFVNDLPTEEGNNHPNPTQATHIFDLDERMGSLFANKRPYDWVSVSFSEHERNFHLYNEENYVAGSANINISQMNAHKDVWDKQLFQLYGAFASLYNGEDTDDPLLSWKMPVTLSSVSNPLLNKRYKPLSVWVPVPHKVTDWFNNNLDGITDPLSLDAFDDLTTNHSIPCLPIGSDPNWFKSGIPQAVLHENFRDRVTDQSGWPGVYVTGHDDVARHVLAGFFVPTYSLQPLEYQGERDLVTVSLSADPMWSFPRAELVNVQGPAPATLEPFDYDPSISYTATNQDVHANTLRVHLPVGGDFQLDDDCILGAYIYFSDPQLTSQNLPVLVVNTPDVGQEFVIDVPAFSHFAVINIKQLPPKEE